MDIANVVSAIEVIKTFSYEIPQNTCQCFFCGYAEVPLCQWTGKVHDRILLCFRRLGEKNRDKVKVLFRFMRFASSILRPFSKSPGLEDKERSWNRKQKMLISSLVRGDFRL